MNPDRNLWDPNGKPYWFLKGLYRILIGLYRILKVSLTGS